MPRPDPNKKKHQKGNTLESAEREALTCARWMTPQLHTIKPLDRDAILQWTKVLNDATQHLAEIMMNRSVKEALAGKHIEGL